MKKKSVKVFALLMAMTFILTGCGGKKAPDEWYAELLQYYKDGFADEWKHEKDDFVILDDMKDPKNLIKKLFKKALFLVEGVAEEGAVHDGAAQGQLVGVLDLVAHAHAARQDGDFDVGVRGQAAKNVEVGGVALHRRAQGQDYLLHPTLTHALLQAIDLDVTGADAVHGRNEAAQHVVQAMVLVGVLDAHHVLDVLDDADGRGVTRGVAADGAHLGLADVVAHLAVTDLAPQPDDGLAKVDGLLLVLLEQMQHEAQGGLSPDARQLGELADRRFQQA